MHTNPNSTQNATSKRRAVEVVADKLWIIYQEDGAKTGLLRTNPNEPGWMFEHDDQLGAIAHDVENGNIDDIFVFESKEDSTAHSQRTVFGYPVSIAETFNHAEQNNLPCFTKKAASKVFFAAGYYMMLFPNNGWTEAFCPKVTTLETYKYIGPFKTEHDRDIVLLRKKREER
jgi:hypothetical protein